jgi:methionyl-tRNA formyltransferase
MKNNVPYIQPENLEKEEIWDILRTPERSDGNGQRKFSAENFRGKQNISDFFLVVAYGKILPEEIINLPRLGSINIHFSLLPKYRGASPVESAILNSDTETGVTIQKMEYKMDAGIIIAQEKVNILPNEKAPDLRARLIKIGGELLIKTISILFASGTFPYVEKGWVGVKQDKSQATFCKKIKKEDGFIDLNDDAIKNYNKFRAYAAWPRTFFFRNGKRIIITDAILKNNQFIIKKVLPEGKKEIKWEEFLKTNIST